MGKGKEHRAEKYYRFYYIIWYVYWYISRCWAEHTTDFILLYGMVCVWISLVVELKMLKLKLTWLFYQMNYNHWPHNLIISFQFIDTHLLSRSKHLGRLWKGQSWLSHLHAQEDWLTLRLTHLCRDEWTSSTGNLPRKRRDITVKLLKRRINHANKKRNILYCKFYLYNISKNCFNNL